MLVTSELLHRQVLNGRNIAVACASEHGRFLRVQGRGFQNWLVRFGRQEILAARFEVRQKFCCCRRICSFKMLFRSLDLNKGLYDYKTEFCSLVVGKEIYMLRIHSGS